jgi:hypothetical protein
MEAPLPVKLERHLEFIGVLRRLPEEFILAQDPKLNSLRSIDFRRVELDANGEPPW